MRSRISSGTLGRPSGNLSPCQSGVYVITSSGVKNPSCPMRGGVNASNRAPTAIPARILCILFSLSHSYELMKSFTYLFLSFEPRRSRDLCLFGHFFVHLHAKARFVGWSDVPVHNDFAFLYPCLP